MNKLYWYKYEYFIIKINLMINSQSSGFKNTLGGSKRYVSPYEKF